MDIDDRGWGRGGGRGGGGGGQRKCDHFSRTGSCKFGDSCRFLHVNPGQGKGRGGGRGGGGGGGGSRTDRVDQSRDTFGGNGGAFGRLSGGVFGSGGGAGGGGGGGGGTGQRQVCRNYSRTGTCRFGDQCRHIHEGAPSSDSTSPFGGTPSSPFGQPAASPFSSSPFGGASSSPFGGASSSAFGAAPSSPFGGASASPFVGAAPSSPFGGGVAATPQPTGDFAGVARQFVQFFYETFCSARRGDLQVLLRPESCLTLNDQKLGGRERIMQQFMSLPMDLSSPEIRSVESHPTGPDMSSVLVLVLGTMKMQNAVLTISHVFVLMKAPEQPGQYWISNMIQRWGQ